MWRVIHPSDLAGIDWVIVGGESGPRARPMDPSFGRSATSALRRVYRSSSSNGAEFRSRRTAGNSTDGRGMKHRASHWPNVPRPRDRGTLCDSVREHDDLCDALETNDSVRDIPFAEGEW